MVLDDRRLLRHRRLWNRCLLRRPVFWNRRLVLLTLWVVRNLPDLSFVLVSWNRRCRVGRLRPGAGRNRRLAMVRRGRRGRRVLSFPHPAW